MRLRKGDIVKIKIRNHWRHAVLIEKAGTMARVRYKGSSDTAIEYPDNLKLITPREDVVKWYDWL